jgi:Leucine-rich repeat (LRR) protein
LKYENGPSAILNSLSNLLELSLRSNNLTNIPENAFSGLHCLKKLTNEFYHYQRARNSRRVPTWGCKAF